jgi:hypothetical protein
MGGLETGAAPRFLADQNGAESLVRESVGTRSLV